MNQKPSHRTRVLYGSTQGSKRRDDLQRFFARTRIGDLVLCAPGYAAGELRHHAAQFGFSLEFEPLAPSDDPRCPAHIIRVVARCPPTITELVV